ncbi:MAG: Nif11-like leader peptide family natural product precursor [Gammaproteobacteria bacterium]|nr:Nif11-like leader peptide family natural product precursor [Gammaproteobacteria bacterium]
MSIEQASEFLEKVKSDEALFSKMQELDGASERRELAKEMGFSFSKEDMLAAIDEAGHELSDTELDFIAGGSTASNAIVSTVSATVAAVGAAI